jgi:hypothetical protein
MYGSKTFKSAYANLIVEAVEGGGMLVFVASRYDDPAARITLSAAQVAELRQWMDTDRTDSRSGSVAPE